ncbi:MAG: hypothetical protein ACRDTC_20390 [Pseudonocardiaceae bacterium]
MTASAGPRSRTAVRGDPDRRSTRPSAAGPPRCLGGAADRVEADAD